MSAPIPGSEAQPGVPERPSLEGLEAKWDRVWEAQGTYRFDRTKQRTEVYAIDTPPPTVSGSLHLGTVFGYVQFDAIARFWRMRGKEVFFPVGWDDNGLPTERRVQNHYGVRCDPSLPPCLVFCQSDWIVFVKRHRSTVSPPLSPTSTGAPFPDAREYW